jgi:hypothetical protein
MTITMTTKETIINTCSRVLVASILLFARVSQSVRAMMGLGQGAGDVLTGEESRYYPVNLKENKREVYGQTDHFPVGNVFHTKYRTVV